MVVIFPDHKKTRYIQNEVHSTRHVKAFTAYAIHIYEGWFDKMDIRITCVSGCILRRRIHGRALALTLCNILMISSEVLK